MDSKIKGESRNARNQYMKGRDNMRQESKGGRKVEKNRLEMISFIRLL